MSKDTKKNIKGTDNRKNTNSKIPKNLKTQDRQNAMKRISKTRQAKMREEEVWCEAGFGSGSCDWMCTTVFLWKECDGGQEQWPRCLDSGRKQSNKGQSI